MNFKDLLKLTEESRGAADSFRTTGEAMKKERAKASAPDAKAKDAARKRAERAKKTPRSRMSKDQLIREVIAVRTASGRVQLIFKDSFNKEVHTKLNKGETMTVEEAKALTQDSNFEQTGASKLLFGEIKEKEAGEKKAGKAAPEAAGKKEKQAEEEPEEKPVEKPEKRAKRLSQEEIFQMMTQMGPEQLAQMPFEIRQQYFMQMRNPPSNNDFDNASFETLSTKFGISTLSSTPYNQQVINALVFLAKLKAGASEQELETYTSLAPNSLEFTKNAFLQAKKILSQIGEQCIQTLVSTVENGTKSISSEGGVDMECGDYKFKVSVGGEFSLTTDKFEQGSKNFRGIIANAMNQALSNPETMKDPKVQQFMNTVQQNGSKYGQQLITRDSFAAAKNDPNLMAQLQQTPVVDGTGRQVGTVVDANGNLNPMASFENYEAEITKTAPSLFKNNKQKTSDFFDSFIKNTLKTFFRGDNIKAPEAAPNHVLTQNGIFRMTDAYFDEISRTATVSVKPSKTAITRDNIDNVKKTSLDMMSKYMTMIEAKQEQPSLFIDRNSINPLQLAMAYIGMNMDFDINASLLPGFSPKDLNAVKYNIVRIGKKTVKIPVERTDNIAQTILGEASIVVNDILIEALSNNFVLSSLVRSQLLTHADVSILGQENLLFEDSSGLKTVYHRLLERVNQNPHLLAVVMNQYNTFLYEKNSRDYKMEYRNYHGKPKQRKERAKRTAARERLMKSGKVKKGDGKDIDHKKALRHGGSNGINNLRIRDKSENRADNGHKKGEKQDKDWK